MNHLESHHILNDFQYGFRPGHSCQAQLISIIEEIQYALDHSHQVDLIMLDFCKAFDTVAHNHLLNKLKYYGIQGKIYKWLFTWLTQSPLTITPIISVILRIKRIAKMDI